MLLFFFVLEYQRTKESGRRLDSNHYFSHIFGIFFPVDRRKMQNSYLMT